MIALGRALGRAAALPGLPRPRRVRHPPRGMRSRRAAAAGMGLALVVLLVLVVVAVLGERGGERVAAVRAGGALGRRAVGLRRALAERARRATSSACWSSCRGRRWPTATTSSR